MKTLKRLIGIIIFFSLGLLQAFPMVIAIIMFGMNQTNVWLSTIMRIPLNWIDDGFGDYMLKSHKEMLKEKYNPWR